MELTLLFVDVRGSTALAETMSATAYSALLNRFYRVVTKSLVRTGAFIDKFVGDEVMAIYLPVFAGQNHARPAIDAARALLRATGHDDPAGPWLPVGIGVHSGGCYFGTVKGADGTLADFTALGDTVNVAARLAAAAQAGEAIISEAACRSAGVDLHGAERRSLELKGKSHPVAVRVVRAGTDRLAAAG